MTDESAAHTTTEWHHIRIKPTETTLDPERIETNFERLHHLDAKIEFLLVSDGERVEYFAGTHARELDRLDRILRDCFPNDYEFRQADPEIDSVLDTDDDVTTVEFTGRGERRQDWQTRLKPVANEEWDTLGSLPLVSAAETIAEATTPVVYQALLEPKLDWRPEATVRINDLEWNEDTLGQRLLKLIFDPNEGDDGPEPGKAHQRRIDAIETKDCQHSFTVHARAAAVGEDAHGTLTKFEPSFKSASGEFYHVDPRFQTGDSAIEVFEHIRERTVEEPSWSTRYTERLPLTTNRRRELVTDPTTTPNLALLSGARLGTTGKRGLDATPDERTSVDRPPEERLEWYRGPGMPLGHLKTEDGAVDEEAFTLPPALQRLHVALFGRTGSGKSSMLITMKLWNAMATDGADILLDSKGDGMPLEYMRAHYALHGTLENVYYFDCTELLPALSFFDIRDQIESGLDRSTAVEDVVDHYLEVLVGVMGKERFYQAVRSPDIIRYLVKALFDPVHGDEAFSHRDLQHAARRMHGTRDAPPVVDEDLQAMLGGIAANSERSFHELMQGVANRIEKVPAYDRLGELFNHVPEDDEDPEFDLREILDEDAVVIIDTSGLRPENRRGVTLVLLSALWSALRRRARETEDGHTPTDGSPQQPVSGDGGTVGVDAGGSADPVGPQSADGRNEQGGEDVPLVNLYLEEAAEYANSNLLSELLSQGRGFGLSMTLAMQFPGQLEEESPRAYREVLNNVGTIVTGNVAVDSALTTRMATEDMPPSEVGNRLRALSRGEWLVSAPAPFDEKPPRPFVLESMPLPAGHPEGDDPLSDARKEAFQAMLELVYDRTRMQYGLEVGTDYEVAETDATDGPGTGPSTDQPETSTRVDSALPYTTRLPSMVEYEEAAHALLCRACSTRYDATSAGMRRAISCCHDLETVDRDNVPICEINLKLSAEERAASDYTNRQLAFLQAVYAAHQQRYDELAYDLTRDSMVRLQEYVGIESEAVDELREDGLLAHDTDHPHRLFTVTPEGRKEIHVGHREGVAHGDGKGDLSESSLHVAMVEVGRQYLVQEFAEDDDSAAVEVVTYHEVGEHRLDAAGLDADGEVVVTLEAERVNHDINEAVPADYDKMAACEPEAAIWLANGRSKAHEILTALNEPPEGEPRVEKTYSESTPPQQFILDEPGCTDIHTLRYVLNAIE